VHGACLGVFGSTESIPKKQSVQVMLLPNHAPCTMQSPQGQTKAVAPTTKTCVTSSS
jgi:hypothetical protein